MPNILSVDHQRLQIGGKDLVIDWSAWPVSYTFRAPRLRMQGGYSGGEVALTKSETPGTYTHESGWLSLASIYISATYGGADGFVLGWLFQMTSGTDHIIVFRLLNVTADNPGIGPAGLYAWHPGFSNISGPPYEVLETL